MPPLNRPDGITKKFKLGPREARIIAEADVLVIGGGPAGIGAAIGAAEAGAEVILAERYGFLGGCATAGLVMPMMSFHTSNRLASGKKPVDFFPADHGAGKPVISGVLTRLLDRLVEKGGVKLPSPETGYVVPFDPEIFKTAALELLDDSDVNYLLYSLAVDILDESQQTGVVFETKSGPVVISTTVAVDCTGDGDIAAMGDAPFESGRGEDGLRNPMTLMFRLAEFQPALFKD